MLSFVRGGLILIGGLLLAASPAAAQQAEITQHVFDSDGLPGLLANPVPDGGRGTVAAWRMCPPDAACQPVATDGPDDRHIEPGDVAAGTTFEADVIADTGAVTTSRSKPWLGRVTATTPPAVTGSLQVGRLASPVPAAWSGGWEGDRDLLRLEACADTAGRRCETLSAQGEDPPLCPGAGAVLARGYEGWWVRAVDHRVPVNAAFAGVGYDQPRDIPLAQASRTTVRSELAGPVLPASGAFAECAKPTIEILRRMQPSTRLDPSLKPRLSVFASVRCTSACDVVLEVRDARRTIRRRTEPGRRGMVGLPAGTRLVGARATVRVVVNGRHRAGRSVRLR